MGLWYSPLGNSGLHRSANTGKGRAPRKRGVSERSAKPRNRTNKTNRLSLVAGIGRRAGGICRSKVPDSTIAVAGREVLTGSRSLAPSPRTSEFFLQDLRVQIRERCEELRNRNGEDRHQATFLTPGLQLTCGPKYPILMRRPRRRECIGGPYGGGSGRLATSVRDRELLPTGIRHRKLGERISRIRLFISPEDGAGRAISTARGAVITVRRLPRHDQSGTAVTSVPFSHLPTVA